MTDKPQRTADGREIHVNTDSPVNSIDIGPEGGPENYGGASVSIVPIIATGATQQEASAALDAFNAQLMDLIKEHPTLRLAMPDDALGVLDALTVNRDYYSALVRATAAKRARDN